MKYTAQQLTEITSAELIGNPEALIEMVHFDSRNIVSPNNGIFFALNGSQKDGHKFIDDAYKKGIRIFVTKKTIENHSDATFLIVGNPGKALQQWAKYHRSQYGFPIIGITGSNGKTVVKEWLHQLLWKSFSIVRSPKSFNSQIGVPVSVLQMDKIHDLGIFEAGISQRNEMEVLEDIISPNIGVLTNIGTAHSENFESTDELITEKLKLFIRCETLISRFDNHILQKKISADINLSKSRKITYGEEKGATVLLLKKEYEEQGVKLYVEIEKEKYLIFIPFRDDASIQNTLICLCVIYALGLDILLYMNEFRHLLPIEMRLEIKEGIHDSIVINDTFNSDLNSLKIALNTLAHQAKPRKVLVLTDVLQSKLPEQDLYAKVSEMVNAYQFTEIILIGETISKYKRLFESYVRSFRNVKDFLQTLKVQNVDNEAILLKGARVFHLEKVSAFLEKKSHDTVLEVNLQAIVENVNYFRSLLLPETKIMGMVKANSYGTGGFEVAQTLEQLKVDYLGVAYADEGAELRKKGITSPIMVMNPEQNSYSTIIDYQLEPEIYSSRVLNLFTKTLQEKQITVSYPIHIKLETGMNRLGFHAEDFDVLISLLRSNPKVHVRSVFTHLATSDVPEEFDYAQLQLKKFDEGYKKLVDAIGYQPIKHALSSAGITNFTDHQYDMVRLGIGMYGYVEDRPVRKHLKIALHFKTVISQISELEARETVSYGRKFQAQTKSRIATIPVGYADGIRRSLGYGKGKVSINGHLVPIVGTICMDMMMIDVTGVECDEGDEVIIFGDNPSFIDMAEDLGTIPYEVLTSISPRVKRVYFKE